MRVKLAILIGPFRGRFRMSVHFAHRGLWSWEQCRCDLAEPVADAVIQIPSGEPFSAEPNRVQSEIDKTFNSEEIRMKRA